MGLIDAKQIDKTNWNDNKLEWLSGGDPAPIVYNPFNITTYQVARKDDSYSEIFFLFDGKAEEGGDEPFTDGREHKICFLNIDSTSVEIGVGLSPDETATGTSIVRDTIGTVVLPSHSIITIYFYWVTFGDERYCIVHHVVT
jgi:hypothetical protein